MKTQPPTEQEQAASTRQRLLVTALKLYANEGLHAVSLRRISAEAGSRNSAAMHYHFKNRLGVIEALVTMIAMELTRIDTLLRSGTTSPASMREACLATLLPLVRLPHMQPWGRDAVRFISRLVSDNDPEAVDIVNRVYAPFWQRMDRTLAAQLAELPPDVRQLRLMFMSTNVLHGAADVAWLGHSPLGDMSHFNEETLLNHLVDYLVGGLQASCETALQSNTNHASSCHSN